MDCILPIIDFDRYLGYSQTTYCRCFPFEFIITIYFKGHDNDFYQIFLFFFFLLFTML